MPVTCSNIEFENIILLSKLISICAKDRKESRGSHFRTDYDFTSDDYKLNSITKFIGKEIYNKFEEIHDEN